MDNGNNVLFLFAWWPLDSVEGFPEFSGDPDLAGLWIYRDAIHDILSAPSIFLQRQMREYKPSDTLPVLGSMRTILRVCQMLAQISPSIHSSSLRSLTGLSFSVTLIRRVSVKSLDSNTRRVDVPSLINKDSPSVVSPHPSPG